MEAIIQIQKRASEIKQRLNEINKRISEIDFELQLSNKTLNLPHSPIDKNKLNGN